MGNSNDETICFVKNNDNVPFEGERQNKAPEKIIVGAFFVCASVDCSAISSSLSKMDTGTLAIGRILL